MNNILEFECCWPNCKETNYIRRKDIEDKIGKDDEVILCWSCRRVNHPHALRKDPRHGHEGGDYLECIAFEGPEANVPTGYLTVNGVTWYVTANGRLLTRWQFKEEFGSDPYEYIAKRIKLYKLFHEGRIGSKG